MLPSFAVSLDLMVSSAYSFGKPNSILKAIGLPYLGTYRTVVDKVVVRYSVVVMATASRIEYPV